LVKVKENFEAHKCRGTPRLTPRGDKKSGHGATAFSVVSSEARNLHTLSCPSLWPAKPPFFVLPSDSEASLASFGTASLRRPPRFRSGWQKKGSGWQKRARCDKKVARRDILHPVMLSEANHLIFGEKGGDPSLALGVTKKGSGRQKSRLGVAHGACTNF